MPVHLGEGREQSGAGCRPEARPQGPCPSRSLGLESGLLLRLKMLSGDVLSNTMPTGPSDVWWWPRPTEAITPTAGVRQAGVGAAGVDLGDRIARTPWNCSRATSEALGLW